MQAMRAERCNEARQWNLNLEHSGIDALSSALLQGECGLMRVAMPVSSPETGVCLPAFLCPVAGNLSGALRARGICSESVRRLGGRR